MDWPLGGTAAAMCFSEFFFKNYQLDKLYQNSFHLLLGPKNAKKIQKCQRSRQIKITAKTSNGTAKVLVMGNSYGYRAFPVLHRLFNGRYAQMRLFTRSSELILLDSDRIFKKIY